MSRIRRTWLAAAYSAVALAPLVLIAGAMKAGAHSRLVVFADALGFAALSLLCLQIVSCGRWAATTRTFGLRWVLSLHRQAGIAVLLLVVVHVAAVVLDDPARLTLLESWSAPPQARAGMLALLALVVLAAASAWRGRLRLGYARWRTAHLVATVLALTGAFAHVMWVDAAVPRHPRAA